jgi:hypothetical protein
VLLGVDDARNLSLAAASIDFAVVRVLVFGPDRADVVTEAVDRGSGAYVIPDRAAD